MTVRPPAYQSEPQIQFLYQLVREIGDGHLQLPRFQRPFLWTEDQQLELFRSIRMGTPIGSIMVWRTNLTDVRAYDKLGPYTLKPASGPIRSYIIDGHQRLATLFGALHVPVNDEDLPERIAYFDLESDDFLFAQREEPTKPMWLPLRYVLDFPSLLPFQRSFGGQPDEKDLVRRTDIIVTAFSSYKIPVLPVATNDIDHITKTFQRINSQGTVMSEVHMVAALTWSETFDLNERIAAWKEEHLAPLGYGELDDDVVLHACKAALGFDVYDGNVDKVSNTLREKPEAIDEAGKSLVKAMQFLRDECRILSPKVLPYPSHIVPLAEAIRRVQTQRQNNDAGTLRRWFWLLAYTGTRAGIPKLLAALEEMYDHPNGVQHIIVREPRPMPVRFDFRNARCKVFALRLAERMHRGDELLAREGAQAMAFLFLDRWSMSSERFVSHANRILVASNDAQFTRKKIHRAIAAMTEGKTTEQDRDLLDDHLIPYFESPSPVNRDFFDILIEQRAAEIDRVEVNFFAHSLVP